jgi:hypothetical protein
MFRSKLITNFKLSLSHYLNYLLLILQELIGGMMNRLRETLMGTAKNKEK